MMHIWGIVIFLAQTVDGSGMGDFLEQIASLLAITAVAGVIWVALMVVIAQRAGERRQRKAQGLPPPPSIFDQFTNTIQRLMGETPTKPSDTNKQTSPIQNQGNSAANSALLPDLDALTNPIPEPNFDNLVGNAPSPFDDIPLDEPLKPAIVAAAISSPSIRATEAPAINLNTEDAAEVLRVWRDLITGNLLIEMKGQVFSNAAELQASGLSQRYTNLLSELSALAKLSIAPAAPPNLASFGLTPTPKKKPVEVEDDLLNVPAQIEAILQKRLRDSNYAGRDVHVRPSVDGGVLIEVDGQFYNSLDDVPDADIRAFIQAAIHAWEQSN